MMTQMTEMFARTEEEDEEVLTALTTNRMKATSMLITP